MIKAMFQLTRADRRFARNNDMTAAEAAEMGQLFWSWGRDAARQGWGRDQNPYPEGSRARPAWDKGWQAGRRPK